jgi:hypothetical protein
VRSTPVVAAGMSSKSVKGLGGILSLSSRIWNEMFPSKRYEKLRLC